VGEALVRQVKCFFGWYNEVREGRLGREDFEKKMREVEREVGGLLRRAQECTERKTAGMAREMLRFEKCLWTFVDVPGLEPTNNFAERCLRHAVMYRKTSFGTKGPEGSRFVERLLTVVTALKLQQRSVLDFLTDTLHARRRRRLPPSLLPTQATLAVAV
jgi:transposase